MCHFAIFGNSFSQSHSVIIRKWPQNTLPHFQKFQIFSCYEYRIIPLIRYTRVSLLVEYDQIHLNFPVKQQYPKKIYREFVGFRWCVESFHPVNMQLFHPIFSKKAPSYILFLEFAFAFSPIGIALSPYSPRMAALFFPDLFITFRPVIKRDSQIVLSLITMAAAILVRVAYPLFGKHHTKLPFPWDFTDCFLLII